MSCLDGRCHYVADDEFFCAVTLEGPDPCGFISDEAACNAKVSTAGSHECAWVERRTVVSAEACTVSESDFECIHVRDTGTGCTDAPACGAEGLRVYWFDEGGGTVDLLRVPCDLDGAAPDLWRAAAAAPDEPVAVRVPPWPARFRPWPRRTAGRASSTHRRSTPSTASYDSTPSTSVGCATR
ncbi:MAG: hypothetical protein AAF799_10310 [Myxococcota bacterium]